MNREILFKAKRKDNGKPKKEKSSCKEHIMSRFMKVE
jgi:hypothetical protein